MVRLPPGRAPFRELLDLQERLQRLLGRSMDDPGWSAGDLHGGAFEPPCDLFDTEDGFVLELELPGVDASEVHLTAVENSITIRGVREASQVKGASHLQLERPLGPFARRMELPAPIDPARVTAGYEEGILRITAPRKSDTRRRRIRVKKG